MSICLLNVVLKKIQIDQDEATRGFYSDASLTAIFTRIRQPCNDPAVYFRKNGLFLQVPLSNSP